MIVLEFIIIAFIGYLLGSISFSIIFTWLFTKQDVRDFGSGNAGATNVFRMIGLVPGILTFIFDMAKGISAILLASIVFDTFSAAGVGVVDALATRQVGKCIAGLFAVLGHLFPIYFHFRGGKGVLTVAGIVLILSWQSFLMIVAVFAIIMLFSKTVSIASCGAAVSFPIITLILSLMNRAVDPVTYSGEYCAMMTVVAAIFGGLVVFMHRSNIKRIIDGTEPKISFKK